VRGGQRGHSLQAMEEMKAAGCQLQAATAP